MLVLRTGRSGIHCCHINSIREKFMKSGDWKISTRLGAGFFIVFLFAFLTAAVSMWRLSVVAAETRVMMSEPLLVERQVSDWFRNIAVAVRRTTAIVKSSDPSLGPYFKADSDMSSKNSTELQKAILPLLTGEKEKALYEEISNIRKEYIRTRDLAVKLKAEGKMVESEAIFTKEFVPTAEKYQEKIRELLTMQRKELNESADQIENIYQQSFYIVIGMLLFAALASVIAIGVTTRGLLRKLGGEPGYAADIANSIAQGDLSQDIRLNSGDDTSLMYAIKSMRDNLANIVSEVRAGTATIASASNEIAAGNRSLSSRTEEQAASLEETASSMEEITSTVRQSADNANQANELAANASSLATQGGNVVSQVVMTMDRINDSSKKVVDIISVIDGIAFQTNILALNAAVEAARAGEQGRGFAVVASEVRNLAQRSANAAREITDLINESVRNTESGTKLVHEAGGAINEVVNSVKHVNDIMNEITQAIHEQTLGIEQVNQAITQIDSNTQQNAELVQNAATEANRLQEQADSLVQVVNIFNLGNDSNRFSGRTTGARTRPDQLLLRR